MKEPYAVFYGPDGRELGAYTIRGTFAGEKESTLELLAYENSIPAEKIRVEVENRG